MYGLPDGHWGKLKWQFSVFRHLSKLVSVWLFNINSYFNEQPKRTWQVNSYNRKLPKSHLCLCPIVLYKTVRQKYVEWKLLLFFFSFDNGNKGNKIDNIYFLLYITWLTLMQFWFFIISFVLKKNVNINYDKHAFCL